MTIDLVNFVRLFAGVLSRSNKSRHHPRLDLSALSARDLSDLNLPGEVLSRHHARKEIEDARRRTSW